MIKYGKYISVKYFVICFDVSRFYDNVYLCKKMNINKIVWCCVSMGYINFL